MIITSVALGWGINMKKFTVKRNEITISEYTSDFADETHYEENWGKPEHTIELAPAIQNEDGTITEAIFKIIPSEYSIEILDITAEIEEKERINIQIAKGERSKSICDKALSLIRGYNGSNLTDEQIMEMMTSFSILNELLRNGWVTKALEIVNAIVPDEVLVSSQMKADVLNILNGN
jgi:hypothetical protein